MGCLAMASRSEGTSTCTDAKVYSIQKMIHGSPTKDGMSRGDGVGEEGSSESLVPGGAGGDLETSAASRSKQNRNNLKK